MNDHNKTTVRMIGLFFLVAMVGSLAGGMILESVIAQAGLITQDTPFQTTLTLGVILEIINALAVLGIAIFMFPLMSQRYQKSAVGYLSFRIIEALFCFMATLVLLLMTTVSDALIHELLANTRSQLAGLAIPIFFCLGAAVFYLFIYRSGVLPRFIPIWGLIGVLLILILNLSGITASFAMIFALPIIINEIFLGFWLLIKGFRET